MRLKICDSHLTCKVANKCLNVRGRVEVVEWNERWSPLFSCCPVNRQCLWKKTLIEKKTTVMSFTIFTTKLKAIPEIKNFSKSIQNILVEFKLLSLWKKLSMILACNTVDTGRQLNVDQTFSRRPLRFLNVLCTFNLRPESTGKFLDICPRESGKFRS